MGLRGLDGKDSEHLAWRAILGVLVAGCAGLILVAGVVVHVLVRDFTAGVSASGLRPFTGTAGTAPGTTPVPGATPLPPLEPVNVQPWNGSSRVTLLVMGLDYRDWEAGTGAPRSDSMMLVTIDPITRRAGMLSIPRDLWVEIPGFDHNRINTAYMLGEAYRLPGGGPALARQTVEDVIGVPINYYAVIDFKAFERMIDEIGGIDILVEEPIRIAPIGRMSINLEAKAYHFDGPEALAFARVRKAAGDDFGRARRQQRVVLAVLDRVVGFDMLPTLIARAPALYQELASGVRTDLSLDQMVSLGWLAMQVPKESILSGVIGPPNMVRFYTRPDGAKVIGAVPDQIRILRDEIFTATSGLGPSSGLIPPPSP
ncbi:MAG: LCP family protein [Anaerolineales bacterium]|nr:LCP family protein [Anaerolineales bacterium]